MTAKKRVVHMATIGSGWTLCEKLWVFESNGKLYIENNAVDNWKFVTCKRCLAKRKK